MHSIKANGYSIHLGEDKYDILNKHIEAQKYSVIFILTDTNSNTHCLPNFLSNLASNLRIEIIEIAAGEAEKNITNCIKLWKILTELGGDRKSILINLGGGVITDIGGFVASTFKRGIDFINIPTTLLGMVDASIGGKNGVDLDNLKNQIGVINVPQSVIIDYNFLETLPQKEMRSGFAEMLKHGLIHDKSYWLQLKTITSFNYQDFGGLIQRSIEIKNEIVLQDATENGIRKALNFGHTLGHAIESYFLENDNKNNLLHGEAIAAGMILECYISWQKKLITEIEYFDIKNTINSTFEKIVFEENDIEPILNLLIHDKKNEYGKIQFVLLEGIGQTKINQEIEMQLIINGFSDYIR